MERLDTQQLWHRVRGALAETPIPLRAALSIDSSVERRIALDRLSRFVTGRIVWREVEEEEREETLPLFPELETATEEDPDMPTTDAIEHSTSFGAWLIAQSGRQDALGDLARQARSDSRFPRNGSPKDVSKRLNELGADGDVHLLLEDAELDWLAL